MQILIATKNPGKVREFRDLLAAEGLTFTDLSQHPELETVEETGDTFAANAALKATGYAKELNSWALADDSGLAVDALAGSPGVHSARWAELNNAGKGDAANNALLLKQLEKIQYPHRTARFICALALANPKGQIILTATDTVEGRILKKERGAGGFGYDPLFLIESLHKTTGELPPEEKHKISHRGKALRRLAQLMKSTNLATPGRTS